MKNFILPLILIVISNSVEARCTNVQLTLKNEKIDICHFKDKDNYLSKNCRDPKSCFFEKSLPTIELDPKQSPGFTLCYQLKGEPFFGILSNKKTKVPMCKKGDFIADLDSLLIIYRDQKGR